MPESLSSAALPAHGEYSKCLPRASSNIQPSCLGRLSCSKPGTGDTTISHSPRQFGMVPNTESNTLNQSQSIVSEGRETGTRPPYNSVYPPNIHTLHIHTLHIYPTPPSGEFHCTDPGGSTICHQPHSPCSHGSPTFHNESLFSNGKRSLNPRVHKLSISIILFAFPRSSDSLLHSCQKKVTGTSENF